ncbi:MAG: M15 family metallopeptidase [Acidobacteriota bacterium]|nr:M15 family metallopeptidase [Acidobacteriota bacterium]
MKKLIRNKAPFAVIVSLIIAAFAFFLISQTTSKPQAQTLSPRAVVAPISEKATAVEVKNTVSAAPVVKSIFAEAAAQNLNLKNSISWTFGGKLQRGWYLYEALIGELIKTEKSAETPDFANALADWQKSTGLNPTGILDETVLAAIIKTWQSNRLKFTGSASPDELVTAPATDFWDPARPEDLRKVEREAYGAYKKMVAAAAADKSLNLKTDGQGNLAAEEKFLKIVSAHRSREHQERLRAASPNSGRAGLAVNSPHFSGRALDIYVGGEPVTTRDDNRALQIKTPAYRWLVKNAAKFGFKPYFYEPWHWEYAPGAKP